MTLIKSISGIRGTIGGKYGEALTPPDMVAFTSAYSLWIKNKYQKKQCVVVIGRDARVSGPIVEKIISATLCSMGINVINLGLATTPSVELAVPRFNANGGIIITASHNPSHWNALKLLNNKGEFLSDEDGKTIAEYAEKGDFTYESIENLGQITEYKGFENEHIQMITALPLVNVNEIKKCNFRIAVDAVNSVGGMIIPGLLRALGVKEIYELNCTPDGLFSHNPEPLPENLKDISRLVREKHADLGIVVDPDVDRLAIINEDGSFFGEEYTLVAVADYVLSKTPGNTASNLSSSRALKDITLKHSMQYFASAVGEVNVVKVMKDNKCIIGGEGNGGVIYPELHYGRDALVGIALFLSYLAEKKIKVSEIKNSFPQYVIIKEKITTGENINFKEILVNIKRHFTGYLINETDGIKIDFEKGWVHLRKSNTEPVIRLYAEGTDEQTANYYAEQVRILLKKKSEA